MSRRAALSRLATLSILLLIASGGCRSPGGHTMPTSQISRPPGDAGSTASQFLPLRLGMSKRLVGGTRHIKVEFHGVMTSPSQFSDGGTATRDDGFECVFSFDKDGSIAGLSSHSKDLTVRGRHVNGVTYRQLRA